MSCTILTLQSIQRHPTLSDLWYEINIPLQYLDFPNSIIHFILIVLPSIRDFIIWDVASSSRHSIFATPDKVTLIQELVHFSLLSDMKSPNQQMWARLWILSAKKLIINWLRSNSQVCIYFCVNQPLGCLNQVIKSLQIHSKRLQNRRIL